MRFPWRRRRVPAGVLEAVDLRPGERVLAMAQSDHSALLVATSTALVRVAPGSDSAGETYSLDWRFRWDQIDNARWEAPDLSLKVRLGEPAVAVDPQHIRTEVDKTADLPAVVRDRVSESIIASEQIPVEGGSVLAVARRHSETTETIWRVTMGPGVDVDDPEIIKQAEQGLAALRSRWGV